MRVNFITTNYNTYSPRKISFSHGQNIKSLAGVNLGACPEGLIGRIKVRKADNAEAFLNVYKQSLRHDYESYIIKTASDETVGEILFAIRNIDEYTDPKLKDYSKHIFVSELRNFSNPATPYYKSGLEYYKDIGTRLMQIALKRSYEANCNGNIKLISKNESKNWYKNIIGMIEEHSQETSIPNLGLKFSVFNQNSMILPETAKERLSKLKGGL